VKRQRLPRPQLRGPHGNPVHQAAAALGHIPIPDAVEHLVRDRDILARREHGDVQAAVRELPREVNGQDGD
jgi:hypothetical protein